MRWEWGSFPTSLFSVSWKDQATCWRKTDYKVSQKLMKVTSRKMREENGTCLWEGALEKKWLGVISLLRRGSTSSLEPGHLPGGLVGRNNGHKNAGREFFDPI